MNKEKGHWISRGLRLPGVQLAIGLGIGVLALYVSFRHTSLEALSQALGGINPWFVGLGLLTGLAGNLAKTARWKLLLAGAGGGIGFWEFFSSLMVGQAINLIVPGRFGEVTRVLQIGGRGVGKTFVLGTIVVEKIVDAAAYAFLFFGLLLILPLPNWASRSGLSFSIVAVVASLLLFLLVRYRWSLLKAVESREERLPGWVRQKIMPRLGAASASLDVLDGGRGMAMLAFWTVLVWSAAWLTNQFIFDAFDLNLPLPAGLFLLLVLQAGISIPSIPAKIGVFEFICLVCLEYFGVKPEKALSYALVLHLVVLIPIVLPGLAGTRLLRKRI